MAHEQWRGRVAVDIRNAEPDWTPFLQPRAPAGAPNGLMVVWDDVGYGAMDVFGGPIETPTMRRIADSGRRYSLPHHGAVLTAEPDQRTQRDVEQHGMHHGGLGGLSRLPRAHPVENGTIAEVLNERGSNTYAVGKWHMTPGDEIDLSS